MVTLLNVMGLIACVLGLSSCAMAATATHSTNGLLFWLIAAIFFVGAGIIDELRKANPRCQKAPILGPGDIKPQKK